MSSKGNKNLDIEGVDISGVTSEELCQHSNASLLHFVITPFVDAYLYIPFAKS